LDPLYRYQPYALLENFVIDEAQQGKEFGTVLVRYVERFCIETDCSKMMLLSNSLRSEAQASSRDRDSLPTSILRFEILFA
jgi:hypothetical protein